MPTSPIKYGDHADTLSDIVANVYLVRRELERVFGENGGHEYQNALDRLDEATFWIKSIPYENDVRGRY